MSRRRQKCELPSRLWDLWSRRVEKGRYIRVVEVHGGNRRGVLGTTGGGRLFSLKSGRVSGPHVTGGDPQPCGRTAPSPGHMACSADRVTSPHQLWKLLAVCSGAHRNIASDDVILQFEKGVDFKGECS